MRDGNLLRILLLSLLLLCSGCSTMYDWLRANPAPSTTFLEGTPKQEMQTPDFPFRMMWIDKSVDLSKYRKIIIPPVTTKFLMDYNMWEKMNVESVAGDTNKAALEISGYMRFCFENAVIYDQTRRFKLVDDPGPDTLKLELALVQLIPSKAELNIAETVVGIFIWPVALLTAFNSGFTAFEGILRDSQTGKVICTIADREMDEMAILNRPGFQYYGNARYFIERWSQQFIDLMNSKDFTKLKTDFPAKLIVW